MLKLPDVINGEPVTCWECVSVKDNIIRAYFVPPAEADDLDVDIVHVDANNNVKIVEKLPKHCDKNPVFSQDYQIDGCVLRENTLKFEDFTEATQVRR